MKYHGKITYTIDNKHPDIKCVKDWHKDKVLTFEDTYTFSDDYTEDYIYAYIKRDLRLVAGGGYNTEHIHNATFDITKISR